MRATAGGTPALPGCEDAIRSTFMFSKRAHWNAPVNRLTLARRAYRGTLLDLPVVAWERGRPARRTCADRDAGHGGRDARAPRLRRCDKFYLDVLQTRALERAGQPPHARAPRVSRHAPRSAGRSLGTRASRPPYLRGSSCGPRRAGRPRSQAAKEAIRSTLMFSDRRSG